MGQTLGILHTTPVTVSTLRELAQEVLPAVRVVDVLDDSLLPDVIAAGGITPAVTRRMALLFLTLQEAGADLILDACSSVGEAAESLQCLAAVPVLRIDQAMAEAAVRTGAHLGVIATVQSTLDPTARLLERQAVALGRQDVEVERILCVGAYQALLAGRPEEHDSLVREELGRLFRRPLDAVVLAQASMARIVATLPPAPVPIFSSPRLALERVKEMLK